MFPGTSGRSDYLKAFFTIVIAIVRPYAAAEFLINSIIKEPVKSRRSISNVHSDRQRHFVSGNGDEAPFFC